MKRFGLFQFNNYYPCGGWDDFKGAYDTEKEARQAIQPFYGNTQIVDFHTGEVTEVYGK